MPNKQQKRDERTCNGCGTPMWFLNGATMVGRKVYHPNCVPSHDRSLDAEYYAGIRDGWRRHQNKQQFGEDYADAVELATEMREAGCNVADPQPPAKRPRKPQRKIQSLSDADCRVEYKAARKRSSAPNKAAFDARCRELLTEKKVTDPTPQQWVWAARNVTFACPRCGGTGKFVTYVENGQPKGPGGPCYRCNGRGYRSDADERRNYGYDVYYRRIY